jgi:hypothetical protein
MREIDLRFNPKILRYIHINIVYIKYKTPLGIGLSAHDKHHQLPQLTHF